MNNEICEGYKDSRGNQYCLYDLVFNPTFGDIWLVDKNTDKDSECPYCLKLWTSEDEYVMDLDEPAGFIIECHKGDKNYQKLYDECLRILESHKEEGLI